MIISTIPRCPKDSRSWFAQPPSQLWLGEMAVNIHKGTESLFFKNDAGEIVRFKRVPDWADITNKPTNLWTRDNANLGTTDWQARNLTAANWIQTGVFSNEPSIYLRNASTQWNTIGNYNGGVRIGGAAKMDSWVGGNSIDLFLGDTRKVWHSDNLNPATKANLAHRHAWAEVDNKPTTLAGYGILDAIWTPANFNPQNKKDAYSNSLLSFDNRNSPSIPSAINSGVYFDFKLGGVEGLIDDGGYIGSMLFRPYGNGTDFSGGPVTQMGFTQKGNIYHRDGGPTWGGWKKMWDSANFDATAHNHTSCNIGLFSLKEISGELCVLFNNNVIAKFNPLQGFISMKDVAATGTI